MPTPIMPTHSRYKFGTSQANTTYRQFGAYDLPWFQNIIIAKLVNVS